MLSHLSVHCPVYSWYVGGAVHRCVTQKNVDEGGAVSVFIFSTINVCDGDNKTVISHFINRISSYRRNNVNYPSVHLLIAVLISRLLLVDVYTGNGNGNT